MQLSEALQLRADLNRRIQQLKSRLNNNAMVQEGETPAEDPLELIAELDGCLGQLEVLTARINLTNAATLSNGETLTELLARRDCLTLKVGAYRDFLNEASQLSYRASRSEIKIRSTVKVADFQKQVDAMSASLRELDNRIQALNFTTELQ